MVSSVAQVGSNYGEKLEAENLVGLSFKVRAGVARKTYGIALYGRPHPGG